MTATKRGTPDETWVQVAGRRLKLSHLNKVLYPAVGFTKGQVLDYYLSIAPTLLPHLKNRPLTLKRYPEGVRGEFFYEKQCPRHRPDWVRIAPVFSEGKGRNIDFCLVNDLPTLMWVINLADLELHTSLSLGQPIERPTVIAFDLDPGAPADLVDCCRVALRLRELLERFDLESFPKSSGSKGMQVYAPLNTPADYDLTKTFARALAEWMEHEDPERVTSNMKKSLRPGKVFIDWSQNDEHKTTVCVYSLRARERPTVSTPLHWSEVASTAKDGRASRLTFEPDQVLARVEREGDLFRPVLKLKQRLPRAAARHGVLASSHARP